MNKRILLISLEAALAHEMARYARSVDSRVILIQPLGSNSKDAYNIDSVRDFLSMPRSCKSPAPTNPYQLRRIERERQKMHATPSGSRRR